MAYSLLVEYYEFITLPLYADGDSCFHHPFLVHITFNR